jgi:hypothetical protein
MLFYPTKTSKSCSAKNDVQLFFLARIRFVSDFGMKTHLDQIVNSYTLISIYKSMADEAGA